MSNFLDFEKPTEVDPEEDSSVLLSIGDLMSGLIMLFALLFITVQIQLNAQIKKLDEKIIKIQKLQKELQRYEKAFQALPQSIVNALDGKLEGKDLFTVDPHTGDVSIRDRILFDENSAVLKPEGKQFLDVFLPVYSQIIFSDRELEQQILRIAIEGHTSSQGTDSRNLDLSLRRAFSVGNYIFSDRVKFVNKEKLTKKILISGRGEIEANQKQDEPSDRKVVFRFQFRRFPLNEELLKNDERLN